MRIFLLLLLLPTASFAQVISSDNHGFQLKIESIVNVNQQQAYQQFINVGQWWNADHTWFGKAENLTIDAKVNGCFCEIDGDKQAQHMMVSFVNPNNEIKMVGGLGPLQMMGVNGGMSWKFEKIDTTHTKIVFHYQVSGYINGGLTKLAPVVDQVQRLQLNRLTSLLNNGKAENK
jgi:hypothetical protein